MDQLIPLQLDEDSGSTILPSQYNDLIRRRSPGLEGEYRLLWAVLEQAIRTYLRNVKCATPKQRNEFKEVRQWFRPLRGYRHQGLFAYKTICDLLEIDAGRLFSELESIRTEDSRGPSLRSHRLTSLAA